jgi:hypothetical protein
MRAVHPTVLDTDVASLLHRRKLTGSLATHLIGREPLITFVTFGELTKWAEIRHWGVRAHGVLTVGTDWRDRSAGLTETGKATPSKRCALAPPPAHHVMAHRMTNGGGGRNLGTYWAQRPAHGHPQPLRARSALRRVLPARRGVSAGGGRSRVRTWVG